MEHMRVWIKYTCTSWTIIPKHTCTGTQAHMLMMTLMQALFGESLHASNVWRITQAFMHSTIVHDVLHLSHWSNVLSQMLHDVLYLSGWHILLLKQCTSCKPSNGHEVQCMWHFRPKQFQIQGCGNTLQLVVPCMLWQLSCWNSEDPWDWTPNPLLAM